MAKKKITDQDKKLETIREKFLAVLDVCKDYFGLLGDAEKESQDSQGYVWIGVTSDQIGLPRGLYLLGWQDLVIYSLDYDPREEKRDSITARNIQPVMMEKDALGHEGPLTLIQLILDIDGLKEITPEQHAIIKAGLVDLLEEEGSIEAIEQQIIHHRANLTSHYLMNDRVTNQIIAQKPAESEPMEFGIEKSGQLTFLWQLRRGDEGKKKKRESITKVQIQMDSRYLKTDRPVSGFDWAIVETVYSLQQAGYNTATLNDLIYFCTGVTKPSDKQREDFKSAMYKLLTSICEIDITKEIHAQEVYSPDQIAQGYIKGTLIHFTEVGLKLANGRTEPGFFFERNLFISEYNRRYGHMLAIPSQALPEKRLEKVTPTSIAFRRYLTREIMNMKSPKVARNNVITMGDLYENSGIGSPEERANKKKWTSDSTRVAASRYKSADLKIVEDILQGFVSTGWIRGYKYRADGHSFTIQL